jgi:Zn-dependent M28 family amino/carboxypeptidase
MAESGVVPARTVVLALFNAEEEGLIGSCYYVDNPAYAIDAVRAMFSLDMVGAGNGTGLALYGTTERGNAWIAELMDAAATEAGLSYRVAVADPLELSDHVCFSYAGVPNAFASTLGPHSYYHTPADTVETIPLEDVQAAAELMWATLVPLARGTEDSYLGGKRARVERSPADLPDLSRLRTAR